MNDLPYRQLVDAAPDGLIVCDQQGTIVLVNAQGTRMFGYALDELVGQSVDVLVPAAIRPRHHGHVMSYTGAPRRSTPGGRVSLTRRVRVHPSRNDSIERRIPAASRPWARWCSAGVP